MRFRDRKGKQDPLPYRPNCRPLASIFEIFGKGAIIVVVVAQNFCHHDHHNESMSIMVVSTVSTMSLCLPFSIFIIAKPKTDRIISHYHQSSCTMVLVFRVVIVVMSPDEALIIHFSRQREIACRLCAMSATMSAPAWALAPQQHRIPLNHYAPKHILHIPSYW